jgi:hypothetical protein
MTYVSSQSPPVPPPKALHTLVTPDHPQALSKRRIWPIGGGLGA